jgi:hypothetical protein
MVKLLWRNRYLLQRKYVSWKIIRELTQMMHFGRRDGEVFTRYLDISFYRYFDTSDEWHGTARCIVVNYIDVKEPYLECGFGVSALITLGFQAERFNQDAIIIGTRGSLNLQRALIELGYKPRTDDPSTYILDIRQ